jgi:predicted ArsR family transcriptional regulator
MPANPSRKATVAELRALGHPLRWQILRLCLDQAHTNQQLAVRLGVSPPTTLRHVRALVDVGFLEAEPVRTGERGALERPYRATGRTWGLVVLDLEPPELVQQVDLAVLAAHWAELIEAGSDAKGDTTRGALRLGPRSVAELRDRLAELLSEFEARHEPDGTELSYLWSLIVRSDPAGDGGGSAPPGNGSAPPP